MTAEEFLNKKKYNPDDGISFEDYHGSTVDTVPSIMVNFAKYHVTKALEEVYKNAKIIDHIPTESDDRVYKKISKKSILKGYPLKNIK